MGHDPQLRELDSPRLDSWKEIASFLHRDARTVRRWERERRLPVHRVPGGERSGVFAYVAELERWLHASSPATDAANSAHTGVESIDSQSGKTALAPDARAHEPDGENLSKDKALSTAGMEEQTLDPHQASPLSAFRSLNSFETAFAAEHQVTDEQVIPPLSAASYGRGGAHLRHYQILSLALLLSVAFGISAGVIHYRDVKVVKTVAHRPNAEAQELYLRGRYYWNLRTEEALNSAVDLFTQSIVHDPKYAEAYAGLADAYLLLRQYGHMPNSEAYPRALAAARQAIALDDSSPNAHRSIAFILRFWNWDMAAAEKEYRRAIELNPNDSQSHHWYATALLSSNRNREALTQIDIARRLEPQSVSVLADRGLILSALDAHAGALALEQVEQAQPSFLSTHNYLAGAYLQLGDYEKFLAESRTAAELSHNSAMTAVLEGAQRTLAARGPKPMLREIAANFAPLADRGAVPAYTTAHFFGLAGESAEAMRYLHLACDRREPGFLSVDEDAAFTLLRSSAEYNTLIMRRDAALSSSKQPIAKLDTPEMSE